nr:asparaginase [Pectinatus sottacetonis]
MIATGGTIASQPSADGLVPRLSGNNIIALLPALKDMCTINCLELMSIDSSNIIPSDWLNIAQSILNNYLQYDGFVITHGTDTMAYTAAALANIIKNLDKPIILTGAQKPLEMPKTDAEKNIIDSFLTACGEKPGVFLVFNGLIHIGHNVKKIYSQNFIGFESINALPAGKIINNTIHWNNDIIIPVHYGNISIVKKLEENICVIKLIPGLKPLILDLLTNAGYKAIIIEGYGAGGVPNDKSANNFLPAIEQAIKKGIIIICTTQCLYDGAQLDKYPIGILAARLGAISGKLLTTEELTIRLMIILAQTTDRKIIKNYIESNQ